MCRPTTSSGRSPATTRCPAPRRADEVDTLRALVWHFTPEGKADRVPDLSGDQHRTDASV